MSVLIQNRKRMSTHIKESQQEHKVQAPNPIQKKESSAKSRPAVSIFGGKSSHESSITPPNDDDLFQRMANNSQRVTQLQAFQNMANKNATPSSRPAVQLFKNNDNTSTAPIQKKENNTGLPDNLKSGIENLSGYSMDDVKVHYNSDKPAQLQAHAYAQGSDIHLGTGQEKHLPHEAWHVVQQKQGRVKPTMQMKGKVNVNDDSGLEREADVMGAKALQMKATNLNLKNNSIKLPTIQGYFKSKDTKGLGYIVSNDRSIIQQEGEEKGLERYGGHRLFARAGKIGEANNKLKKVNSGIELFENSSDVVEIGNKKLNKIEARNKKSTKGVTEGDNMELLADCGKSNAIVVGGNDRKAVYNDPAGGYKNIMDTGVKGLPVDMKNQIMLDFLEKITSFNDNNFKERVKTIKENIPKFDAIINQKYKIYLIEYRKFEAKKAQITARFNNKTLTRKEAEEEIEIAEEPKKIAYSDWDYNLNQKAEHIWSIYNEQLDKWKDDVDEKLGINQYANPDVGQGYTTSSGGEKYSGVMTWNYHWGGVILKSDDNKDNVVLENYATVPGDENRDWKFKMYGTEKGQTFHDFHKNEKQHGKTPTTMVIEKG